MILGLRNLKDWLDAFEKNATVDYLAANNCLECKQFIPICIQDPECGQEAIIDPISRQFHLNDETQKLESVKLVMGWGGPNISYLVRSDKVQLTGNWIFATDTRTLEFNPQEVAEIWEHWSELHELLLNTYLKN